MARVQDDCSPSSTNSGQILIGTSNWSEASLTQDADWYPRKTMKAAERMAFYAARFPLVEMENNYRFPPTVAVTEQWVERTPPGFTFDVPAWSLLVGQPTYPPSLFEDLIPEIRPDRRERPKLYANHLSSEALDECWRRFTHSLRPLADAGRLGTVICRYPRWLKPGNSSRRMLTELRDRLGDLPAAIELANPTWVTGAEAETTFGLLEDLDFSYVCVDAAEDHPRYMEHAEATTNGLAVIRLFGRRQHEEGDAWREDWRSYRYDEPELREVAPRVRHLAEGADRVHVIFNTCWRDDAVRNGEALQGLLRDETPSLAG